MNDTGSREPLVLDLSDLREKKINNDDNEKFSFKFIAINSLIYNVNLCPLLKTASNTLKLVFAAFIYSICQEELSFTCKS